MLQELLNYLNEISGGNEIMAGMLLIPLTAIIGYIVTITPEIFRTILWKYIVIEISYNNSTWEKEVIFTKINHYLTNNADFDKIKRFSIEEIENEDENKSVLVLSIGYGMNLIIYKKIPMLMTREKLESTGAYRINEEINRNRK